MTSHTNGSGSEGRFLRIETKLDGVAEDVSELKVGMARIETAIGERRSYEDKRVSMTSYKWMRFGVAASFAVGALSLIARFVT